jgi:hypothetical protein
VSITRSEHLKGWTLAVSEATAGGSSLRGRSHGETFAGLRLQGKRHGEGEARPGLGARLG